MTTEELASATNNLTLDEPKKDTTVLDDPKEFNVKHPLNSKWTLWYTKPAVDSSESWSDLLRPVVSFKTVEEFWGIHNSIPKATELPLKSDYHLFRDDIKPEWEDPHNKAGGRWAFQFKSNKRPEIDELWTRSLLSVIGETIESDDNQDPEDISSEVNGVILNVKKGGIRICIWTKTADIKDERFIKIGQTFKRVLKLSDDEKLEFISHELSTIRGSKPQIVL